MSDEIDNEKTNKKTSSFLLKLYQILENREYDEIIKWSELGNSFIIKNLSEFTEKVIPKHFKHSNFSSFVRQLNMYDFHKTKTSLNESQFSHKLFSRGNITLLKGIKRKTNNQIETDKNMLEKLTLDKFLNEKWIENKKLTKKNYERINIILLRNLEDLKTKQKSLESKIDILSQKNNEYTSQNQSIIQEIIKKTEYAKKLESILIFVMEIIFPNKTQFVEKLNLQSGPSTNALPLNDLNFNLKSNEKNDNLIILKSFFEKLMEQPKQIEIPITNKKHEINNLNNCIMLANKNTYYDNNNNSNLHSSNLSIHSSNNSQVSQLINNIEEGIENKRKMSNNSPFYEESGLFGNPNCNSPYISRVECDRFSSKGDHDDSHYMGKKTYRNNYDYSNEVFRMNFNNHDEDNIQITNKLDYKEVYPNNSNAIQVFTKK